VARKSRKTPTVDGWKNAQCLASVGWERRLWTVRRRVAPVTGGEEEDAREEDEGEREGVVRAGAW
jgi:hypothetical protein